MQRHQSVTHLEFRPLEAAPVSRIIILFGMRILRRIPPRAFHRRQSRMYDTIYDKEVTGLNLLEISRRVGQRSSYKKTFFF